MTSSNIDQGLLMKEVLDSLKALQVNQTQLASTVEAIAGRVNILAGIKQVGEVAEIRDNGTNRPASLSDEPHDSVDIGLSPTLIAVDEVQEKEVSSPSISTINNTKMPSVTSRIILTLVSHLSPRPLLISGYVDGCFET